MLEKQSALGKSTTFCSYYIWNGFFSKEFTIRCLQKLRLRHFYKLIEFQAKNFTRHIIFTIFIYIGPYKIFVVSLPLRFHRLRLLFKIEQKLLDRRQLESIVFWVDILKSEVVPKVHWKLTSYNVIILLRTINHPFLTSISESYWYRQIRKLREGSNFLVQMRCRFCDLFQFYCSIL